MMFWKSRQSASKCSDEQQQDARVLNKHKRIVIAAGGTGGHVFPALAIAHYLVQQDYDIHWLGTRQGIEAQLVEKAHIPIHYLTISGWRGKGVLRQLATCAYCFYALLQAICVIRKLQPGAVLGMGGYVAGPSGIAAWLLRCPLLIHEQNAVPGLTNRCLAHLAKRVMTTFPGVFAHKHSVIVTGNPIRQSLTTLPEARERFANRTGPLRLLVLGGSQGAAFLNQLVPTVLQSIPSATRPLVWHQVGQTALAATQSKYQACGVTGRLQAFITDMASAYAWADLVLCRAGATTIAELCGVGIGALLVPYPGAVDDHQTANGKALVAAGGGLLFAEETLTVALLKSHLLALSQDRERLLAMAEASRRLANMTATAMIARQCQEVCGHDE